MAKKKKGPNLFADEDAADKPMNEFDALLNSSAITSRRLSTGDRIHGEILAVTGQEAFVATGTPTDATMPFILKEGEEPPMVGDQVHVVVVRVREGEILVRAVDARGVSGDADNLEDAYDMELPVEGTVLEAVKGGFKVKVQGQRAFCPISQIDWRCTDPNLYVGRKFDFIITRMERGRDLVVSRRKILEAERLVHEGEFLNGAQIGEIFSAKVFRLENYGAFVRLDNGIEGLVPISELSFSRIGHPQQVVNVDQTVEVKLIRMLEEGERLKLSFSLKQGGGVIDPWANMQSEFPIGSNHEGIVDNKEVFGLFVNLSSGVTGLLPRAAWRDSMDAQNYEGKRRGDKVKVRIERIDLDQRRISLSLPRDDEDDSWREHVVSADKQEKSAGANFGSLADLLKDIKLK